MFSLFVIKVVLEEAFNFFTFVHIPGHGQNNQMFNRKKV